MFSGKSSEIIREVNRLNVIQKKVLLINSCLDNRYKKGTVCSHDQNSIKCVSIDNLENITPETLALYEHIIIDESQFFENLFEFVINCVEVQKKNVTVVGLNGDSNRQNFGDIYKLYPYSDSIKLLKAMCIVCKDGTEAIFSKQIIKTEQQTDIGSTDKYVPVCRKCYLI